MEKYRCMSEKCKAEWDGVPGPPNFCPKCNGMYCEWVNFEKDWDYVEGEWKKKDVLSDGK